MKYNWNHLHGSAILEFRGAFAFLSNFHRASFEYGGKKYSTVEHAYQAFKAVNEEDHERIRMLNSPVDAKRAGKEVLRWEDFDETKVVLMTDLVRCKFTQNEEIKRKLLDTGVDILVEGNYWGDVFWGVGIKSGLGTNHLGEILMKIRSELRDG